MEKVFVAQRVANKLNTAEESVDTAMTEAAELMSEMLKARRELGLSTTFGDEAAAKLVPRTTGLTSGSHGPSGAPQQDRKAAGKAKKPQLTAGL